MRQNIRRTMMSMTSVPAIAPNANMVKDGLYTREKPYTWGSWSANGFIKLDKLGTFNLQKGKTYTLQFRTDGKIFGKGDAAGGKVNIEIVNEWNTSFYWFERGTERHIYSNGAHIWTFTCDQDITWKLYFGFKNHDAKDYNLYTYKFWDIKLEEGDIPTHLAYLMGGVISNIISLCAPFREERRAA